ncbi:hypothetical protein HWV62_38490 [Athelia sp. TMB]|nr:hypothetical protein HWV62_38490 [Athelia sp. TMB]
MTFAYTVRLCPIAFNIAKHDRCPVSPHTMSMFIASCAGSYSGSALANYTCSVRAWHIIHGTDWNMDQQVKATLEGAVRLASSVSKKALRAPMTIATLETLNRILDSSQPLDVAVRAALNVMFYSLARTGELTVPSQPAFDIAAHVKLENMQDDVDRNGFPFRVLHLPRTKSAPDAGKDIVFASQSGPLDPWVALQDHLHINDPPHQAHLFTYKADGKHKPLTKPVFIRWLNEAATTLSIGHIKGHSICIGGTLEFLLRGIAFEVVKSLGR